MSRVFNGIYKLLKQFTKSDFEKNDMATYLSSSSGTIDGVTLFRLFKRREDEY